MDDDNELMCVLPASEVTLKHSQAHEPSRFLVLVFKEPLTDERIEALYRLLNSHLPGVII